MPPALLLLLPHHQSTRPSPPVRWIPLTPEYSVLTPSSSHQDWTGGSSPGPLARSLYFRARTAAEFEMMLRRGR